MLTAKALALFLGYCGCNGIQTSFVWFLTIVYGLTFFTVIKETHVLVD